MAKTTNGVKADWIFKVVLTLSMFVFAWYVSTSKAVSETVSDNKTRITVVEAEQKHVIKKIDEIYEDVKELLKR